MLVTGMVGLFVIQSGEGRHLGASSSVKSKRPGVRLPAFGNCNQVLSPSSSAGTSPALRVLEKPKML